MSTTVKRSKMIVIGTQEMNLEINQENKKLLDRYKRDMMMRELSEQSIYSYECDLLAWMRYLIINQFNPVVTDLEEEDIEEFIFFCKEQGNNTERIKRRLASISAFYKFLRRKKIILENPCEFIPRPKKGLPVIQQNYLTEEQYSLMKEKLYENGDLQLLTYAMLSFSTMARVNAVSNITWKQIDFEERTISDVLEKEGKIVTLYFSDETKDLLSKLQNERKEKGIDLPYVFISYYNGIKKADKGTLQGWAKKCGKFIDIENFHAHDFRHSSATLLSHRGMPIEVISSLLNHSGIDVTKNHYVREDKKKMREQKDMFDL